MAAVADAEDEGVAGDEVFEGVTEAAHLLGKDERGAHVVAVRKAADEGEQLRLAEFFGGGDEVDDVDDFAAKAS